MKYRVIVLKKAQKEALKLPSKDQVRVFAAIAALEDDPFQGKKLNGDLEGLWAMRVWPYRILYNVHRETITVTVVRIGHRQSVYGT